MSRFLRSKGALGVWLLGVVAGLTGACAGHTVKNPTSYEIYLSPPTEEPQKYVIQPGDELEVRFFYTPQHNVLMPVRPDGYVSLPLATEVKAAGRTAEDLRLAITAACEPTLRSPEVAVIVRTFSAYKIHVGGHVEAPGVFELSGSRTVLQAVFEAGGLKPSASPENVLVIRPRGEGTFAVIPIDLLAVLEGRDTRQNITLRPYDAIYVAPRPIADVNRWVDQYIRQNLPVDVGWDFQL